MFLIYLYRSTFHVSFLKVLFFLIESTLILLVFKKYKKKTRKIKIYKKRKVEGPILRPKQHFTYKFRSTTHTKSGGGNFERKMRKPKPISNQTAAPQLWFFSPKNQLLKLALAFPRSSSPFHRPPSLAPSSFSRPHHPS